MPACRNDEKKKRKFLSYFVFVANRIPQGERLALIAAAATREVKITNLRTSYTLAPFFFLFTRAKKQWRRQFCCFSSLFIETERNKVLAYPKATVT